MVEVMVDVFLLRRELRRAQLLEIIAEILEVMSEKRRLGKAET